MADPGEVGADGKCPMTGYPCTCVPKFLGHWCVWSKPRTPEEAHRATLGLDAEQPEGNSPGIPDGSPSEGQRDG